VAAGYQPEAALKVTESMMALSDRYGRPPAMLATHPAPEDRHARLREMIDDLPVNEQNVPPSPAGEYFRLQTIYAPGGADQE